MLPPVPLLRGPWYVIQQTMSLWRCIIMAKMIYIIIKHFRL